MLNDNINNTGSIVTCANCGGYVIPPEMWHGTIPPRMCSCISKEANKNYGWICPNCGKGIAPHISSCDCKNSYIVTNS